MIPSLALVNSAFGAAGSEAASAVASVAAPIASPAATGADFSQVFAQVGEAINSLKAGEAASISGVQGHASVQHVVESIMEAQRSLQTAIAIRDKVVSAYQSLSQMAI
ncbi:flagellar hook-basal body complex protein FliE [Methylocapsa aurea]|uniref:flagellar hook-basal body complex protein FliE n=1 Tax=Methylocapsa aurea TaxID=663610 RepID=UPI00056095A2|nr:flagellar hook-basal body complex protein FliE [Methylocapsa aurea]